MQRKLLSCLSSGWVKHLGSPKEQGTVVKARKEVFWSKAQSKKLFLSFSKYTCFPAQTQTHALLPRICLPFQAVVLYPRARGWIWEPCPNTEPKKLYWQLSERIFKFVFFLLWSCFLPCMAIPWQPAALRISDRLGQPVIQPRAPGTAVTVCPGDLRAPSSLLSFEGRSTCFFCSD